MRAVTITDAIQCVLLVVHDAYTVTSIVLYKLEFISVFSHLSDTKHLQVLEHPKSSAYLVRCISLLSFSAVFSPAMMQGALWHRDKKQITWVFLLSSYS